MGLPAIPLDRETPVEERLARLEANAQHIQSDVTEIKVDIRRMDAKIDRVHETLIARIDSLRDALNARIDGLRDRMDALERSFHSAKVWALILYIALAGGLLGVLARGFKWI